MDNNFSLVYRVTLASAAAAAAAARDGRPSVLSLLLVLAPRYPVDDCRGAPVSGALAAKSAKDRPPGLPDVRPAYPADRKASLLEFCLGSLLLASLLLVLVLLLAVLRAVPATISSSSSSKAENLFSDDRLLGGGSVLSFRSEVTVGGGWKPLPPFQAGRSDDMAMLECVVFYCIVEVVVCTDGSIVAVATEAEASELLAVAVGWLCQEGR